MGLLDTTGQQLSLECVNQEGLVCVEGLSRMSMVVMDPVGFRCWVILVT